MRTIITSVVAVLVAAAIGASVFLYPGLRDAGLQGSGYVAKNLCSGHFISGFPADQVMDEALRPIAPTLRGVRYEVDEGARSVDVTLYGLFRRQVVYRPGIGCTLLAPGEESPRFDVTPIQFLAPPANDPWPRGEGPTNGTMEGVDYAALEAAIDGAFSDPDPASPRHTKAVAVIYRGELIAERYAQGVTQGTPLISWSMAKSVTQAQIGVLVREGLVDLNAPPPVPEWAGEGDARAAITLDQLLRMSSGLAFDETYAVGTDVTRMLSQEPDAGAFAAGMPLAHEPGAHWYYSSGTTNLLSRMIRQVVGGSTQDHYLFAQRNVFVPLRANSFQLEPDASGTFIGSSYIYATARDWARLGQLYLQDGIWEGRRILPEGWVEYSRTPTPNNPHRNYGAHFWLNAEPEPGHELAGFAPMWPEAPRDTFSMNGFQGQHVAIVPSSELVIVRLGFSTEYLGAGMGLLIGGVVDAVAE